ncbi:MAG: tetratricopeptide repeat protein [Paludibacteraceae bacterium]|nr:tetratricopeptide repeat protein [Paludibacteraceae bacterium]
MKTKALLAIALCATIPAIACAKKPKNAPQVQEQQQVAEPEEDPVITEDCVVNVSLFNESVKNKQFADAYEPWWEVYNNCPNANKAIYTQGAKILEWKYNNAATEEEKEQIRQLAVAIHDKRIRYFGNDPKYPTAYILGQKALDFCQYYPDKIADAYPWAKESVQGMGRESQIKVLVQFVKISYAIYKSNPEAYGEQFIADYSLASEYLAAAAANPANKNAAVAGQQKDYIDGLFAQSGAADCAKLDELYAKTVKENEQNLEVLGKIIMLYKRVNCTESDVYFAAAEASHKLKPTEESAAGCARMCMKKEDWTGAIDYFKQAINLIEDEDDPDREDYLFNIANINMDKLKRYAEARNYARQSLEVNPNQGRCYLLIGMCYAASQPYSASDMPAAKAAILNKTVFWVAVDQFAKAKRVDPSCAATADKFIASYSRYFPTKEEMFDLPNEFGGTTFIVGGWINESTICRPAK